MQPFINPNLFLSPTYGNYIQNPMPQTQMQPVGISGKYVNDFNEITASDIPMNSPAIFAKNDRSEIQLREWNPNGQITTTLYKAVIGKPQETITPIQPTFNPSEVLDPIFEKLAELEEKIDKLPKTTPSRAKKEGE